MKKAELFLSTLSLRRATNINSSVNTADKISIHALLAESDRSLRQLQSALCHFYPRSPCGERPRGEHHANSQQEFLSTLSLRRATRQVKQTCRAKLYFYPRSPCGERHAEQMPTQEEIEISIHALLAESDINSRFLFLLFL